jgi:hypothetical protein
MTKHIYSGVMSMGFEVSSDFPLDYNELILKIADYITDVGIAGCDLGDVDYWEENEDV